MSSGCGSKSALAELEPVVDQPAAGNPVHPEGCVPGLEPGAAAPIHGHCSDRAGRSRYALPSSLGALASTPTESVAGSEARVDARGRAYFAIDTNDLDSAVVEKQLIAVDPDGTLAWTLDFDGRIGTFAVVADGTLRVIDTSGGVKRRVSRVTRDGKLVERHPLPEGAGIAFAVSASGDLIFTPAGDEKAGRVVATDTRGALRWSSAPLAGYATPAALAPDGRIVVGASRSKQAEVVALDGESGALLWRFADEGYARPPAIAPDGSVRFALGAPDLTTQELVALEADGSERFRTALPGDATSVGELTCVDASGASFVRTSKEVVGVEPDGAVRFVQPLPANGEFSCAVDASGVVLVGSFGFLGLDALSGEVRFALSDGFPEGSAIFFSGPAVVAGDRRVVLMDHGGTVHWLGD